MKCSRAEELFSDDFEGSLPPPLAGELRAHLDGCDECRALHAAFREVVSGLDSYPVPPLPGTLSSRLVAARPAASPIRGRERAAEPPLVAGVSGVAVAALLALMLFGGPPELVSTLTRKVSQTAHQAYSFGVRTYHQTERWIEDLNVLRLTVEVAFEDRLEQINERLRDLELTDRGTSEDGDQSRQERPGQLSRSGERVGRTARERLPRSPL